MHYLNESISILQFFTLTSNSFNLCLHVLNNSFRLFRVAPCGENIIRNFSFRQSWQVFVTGLKTLPRVNFFQDTSYGIFCLFRLQMCLLSVVALSPPGVLKSDMCLLYLFLKVPPVKPVYVSTVCVSSLSTVA